MNLRRIIPGLLVVLFAGGVLLVAAEGETLPAACNDQAPVITEDEQLVERTLYFRGESRIGDADSYPGLVDGQSGPQELSSEAPTGTDHKVDVNASTTLYPGSLPGNPIMSAWHAYFDNPLRVACFSFDYWAVGDGEDMAVQLWPDTPFILGDDGAGGGDPVVATATATGPGLAKYSSKLGLATPRTIDFELFAQIEASTPASILYDSTDYPSSITLVTIEPVPPPLFP